MEYELANFIGIRDVSKYIKETAVTSATAIKNYLGTKRSFLGYVIRNPKNEARIGSVLAGLAEVYFSNLLLTIMNPN